MALCTITVTGGVTSDIKLNKSKNGNSYTSFSLAVTKGFGESEHTLFFNCVSYGTVAERMVNAKVKIGSQIYITGDFDLEEYERKDLTKGVSPKVTVYDWSYLPMGFRPRGDSNSESNESGEVEIEQAQCENGLPYE